MLMVGTRSSLGTSRATSTIPGPKAGGGLETFPSLIRKPPEHFGEDKETSSGSFEKGRHLPGLVAVTAKNEESPSKLPVKMHDPSPCSFIHMISRSRPAFLKLMCKHASHRRALRGQLVHLIPGRQF